MKFLEAKKLPKAEQGEHKMQPGVREDQRGMLRGSRSDVTEGDTSGIVDASKHQHKKKAETTTPKGAPVSGVTDETDEK